MVRLNHFQFSVEIGDRDAEEHDIRINPENTVTCYVEAIAGALFRLRFQIDADFDFDCYKLTCKIWIDGDREPDARIVVTRQMFESPPRGFLVVRDGAMVNNEYEKLRFKELVIRETQLGETVDPEDQHRYAELGTIKAEVYKSRHTGNRTIVRRAFFRDGEWVRHRSDRSKNATTRPGKQDDKGEDKNTNMSDNSETIPEKALKGRSLDVFAGFRRRKRGPMRDRSIAPSSKGVSRSASYRSSRPSRPQGVEECERHECQVPVYAEDAEPIARFVMKYRTRTGLNEECIVVPPDDGDSQRSPESYRRWLARRREQVKCAREERHRRMKAFDERHGSSSYHRRGFAIVRAEPKKWYGSTKTEKKAEVVDLRHEDET